MAIFGVKNDKFNFGKGNNGFDDYANNDSFEDEIEEPVSVAAPQPPAFNPQPLALKIIAPKSYDDAREITDLLMNGNTILINMESVERELMVRIVDYLKGAIQVVGGVMDKVGKATLVVAPKNVDISSIGNIVGSNN